MIQRPIDGAGFDANTTVQETHLIQTESLKDVLRTEEHFSSEVKSFVVLNPPKFKKVGEEEESPPKMILSIIDVQMIKAYRIQPTDKITLLAEVLSYPAAEFTWFLKKMANELFIYKYSPQVLQRSTRGSTATAGRANSRS